MQIKRYNICFTLLSFSFLLLVACGGGSNPDSNFDVSVTKIEITQTVSQLSPNETLQLNVIATLSDDSTKNMTADIEWETNDSGIATISTDGLLETKEYIDEVEIFARYQTFEVSVKLSITVADGATLASFSLSPGVTDFVQNEEITVSAVYDDGSIDKNMTFLVKTVGSDGSSGQTVLEVSNDKGLFEAVITDAIQGNTASAELAPVVESDPVLERIEIFADTAQLDILSSTTLTVKGFYDRGAAKNLNDGLSWKSLDENIASVNLLGVVSSYQLSSDVQITVDYVDEASGTTFSDQVEITVYSPNSFDFMRLTVGDNLTAVHIEDNSSQKPLIKAFQNPVGILPNVMLSAPYEGFYITLENSLANEQLVLAIANPVIGVVDKSEAMGMYLLNGEYYLLDNTSATSLSITLDSLGTTLGEISQGVFTAILCKQNAGDCSLPVNQLPLSGSFYVAAEADQEFQSYPVEAPKLIDETIGGQYQQISQAPSYYRLPTVVDSQYEIRVIPANSEVSFEVYSSLNDALLGTSSLDPESGEHVLSFIAELSEVYIVYAYQGVALGTTFQMNLQVEVVAPSENPDAPFLLNDGEFFTNRPGQTDNNATSYYEIKVTPGYTYRVSISKDGSDIESKKIAAAFIKIAFAESYISCSEEFVCVAEMGESSSIFIKVDGPEALDSYAKYTLSVEYNPVRADDDPNEAFTVNLTDVVDLKGQVPYGQAPGTGPSANSSLYWVEGVKASTYYKVSLSGLQDGTRLWINGSLDFEYNCSGGVVGTAIFSDVYCIVKTSVFAFGLSLDVDNSFVSGGSRGTTYTLNISEVPTNELYHFSTFANESTVMNGSAEVLGYNLYLNDSKVSFAVSMTYTARFYKKLFHLRSGESVYIKIADVRSQGNAYTIHVGDTYPTASIGVISGPVSNPDIHELNNDNTQANATRLLFNVSSKHSLSNNSDNYGDVDWFVFTAP